MPDSRFYTNHGPFTLAELCNIIAEQGVNARPITAKDGVFLIEDIGPLDGATDKQISFLDNRKYLGAFKESQAGAAIVHSNDANAAPDGMALIVSDEPYAAFALASAAFYPESLLPCIPFHNGIADDAEVDATAKVAPSAVIAAGARIGNHTVIGPHCVIGPGVHIGDSCMISAGCVISHASLADGVVLYPGVKIGQDGFGYAPCKSGVVKVPQLGAVLIAGNVEIGANTTIDRGSTQDTMIGAHTKIDNLVQIGHNAHIGSHCFIVSQAGLAGSSKIGNAVMLGGQCGIAGHISLGDGVQVAAQSGVVHDIEAGTRIGGSPALPARQWHRQTIALKKLATDR